MQNKLQRIVVLGTGGTIAGDAANADDELGYRAATRSIDDLLSHLSLESADAWSLGPHLAFETEQVAQLDSKDMDFATWRVLARRVAHHLARDEVGAIVITHGSDTLEETAYFLQRLLAPKKPVVFTAAMRPASSSRADGPRNLRDAITLARDRSVVGVTLVMAGEAHTAVDVHKAHSRRLDAFVSGDAGVVGRFENDRFVQARDDLDRIERVGGESGGVALLPVDLGAWPAVEIVSSHAGASPRLVSAMGALGVQGIVVAATGNGTVHRALEAALLDAQAAGIRVLRATRCLGGGIAAAGTTAVEQLPSAGALTPVKARVELILQLLAATHVA